MIRKVIVVGLAVALMGATAHAQSKPKRQYAPEAKTTQSSGDTLKMSCAAAREMVVKRNAVVLHTGAEFDRYVSSSRYCGTQEHTHPALLRARDNPLCFVGYYCDDPSDQESGGGEPGGGEGASGE